MNLTLASFYSLASLFQSRIASLAASALRLVALVALLPLLLSATGERMVAAGETSPADRPAAQSALGEWQPTGPLNTPRGGHTATLLPDGTVLAIAAGGNATADPAESSIERYDPNTGTWQPLASLRPPRRGHTATLLPAGTVLIAGGDGGMGQPSVPEATVLDPATGNLAAVGAMRTPRHGHTATLLPDGTVLAIGGGNPGFLGSIERFNPATGQWSVIGQLQTAREYHTATLLPDGTVLVVGGASAGGRLSSVERVNLATGASSIVAQLAAPRGFHTATLLPDGRVLIAGGDNGSGDGFPPKAEFINPATGAVRETSAMRWPRRYHTATLLPDGKVLIAGGDRNSPLAETELFDPETETWTPGPTLNAARRFHAATLLIDGSVLVEGGWGIGGALASAERLPMPCDVTIDVPVSTAAPDATFDTLLTAAGYTSGKRKGLGATTIDRHVAHSFTGLQKPGMRVVEATLHVMVQPSGGGSSNDAIHVLVASAGWMPRISRFFGSWTNPGVVPLNTPGWSSLTAPVPVHIPLHTSQIPSTASDMMNALNDKGRLDILVQDDTTVVRMWLTLRYVCCDVWMTVDAGSGHVGAELDPYMTGQGFPANLRKGFGDQTVDRAVGHTFALPKLPGATITAARLHVNARPGGNAETVFADPHNDAIHVLVAGGLVPPTQSWSIDKNQATPPPLSPVLTWQSGGPAQALPVMDITAAGVLAAMNGAGRLDVFIQDDTTVYSMRLELFYACCNGWAIQRRVDNAAPAPDLVNYLNGIGFQNGIKGFGDPQTNSAFAHSFTGLGRPGMHISEIELVVRGPGVGDTNDTASVLVAPAAATQTNWPLNGNWDTSLGQSKPLVLKHGFSTNAFFAAVDLADRVDVYVQDDTQVDGLILRLRYDCGPYRDKPGPAPAQPPASIGAMNRPDLWVDDTPYVVPSGTNLDTGIEPDPGMIGQPMWQSRAIWVRQAGSLATACTETEHQNPAYMGQGNPNIVCVKVTNRGQMAGTGTVRVYWAQAALGLGWNSLPGGQPGTTNGDWTEMTASAPVSLAPGETKVVALSWVPPEPASGQVELHTCLLARIVATAPDHIWSEGADVNDNTTKNNDIAWRNVSVVNGLIVGEVGQSIPVILRNLRDAPRPLAVQIRPVTEGGRPSYFEQGSLRWHLPRAVYDAWVASGAPGHGFRHVPRAAAIDVEGPDGALISGLALGARQAVQMELEFRSRAGAPFSGQAADAETTFDVEMVQLADVDGLLVEEGGVAYAVHPDVPPTPTPTFTPTPTPSPTPAPTSGVLANIATRGFVGTGGDVLIGGLISRGAPVKVVLRAIGPSMASQGVPNPLLNPSLRVFSGQTVIGENDNWQTGNCAAEAPVGLHPKDPREACLVLTLAPGAYTAIVSGVGGTTGVGLVEVFKSGGAGELVNIATRGSVGTGADVLIGGLILQNHPTKVILRAIGPSMASQGVPRTLQDPLIRIFSGQTEIGRNDNWQTGNCAAEAPAGLRPQNPREACLVLTLLPGAYTAIVSGVGDTTGVGLVEVFKTGP